MNGAEAVVCAAKFISYDDCESGGSHEFVGNLDGATHHCCEKWTLEQSWQSRDEAVTWVHSLEKCV